ncbi:hypothetical protein ES702_03413 [subsurface metagenome]
MLFSNDDDDDDDIVSEVLRSSDIIQGYAVSIDIGTYPHTTSTQHQHITTSTSTSTSPSTISLPILKVETLPVSLHKSLKHTLILFPDLIPLGQKLST